MSCTNLYAVLAHVLPHVLPPMRGRCAPLLATAAHAPGAGAAACFCFLLMQPGSAGACWPFLVVVVVLAQLAPHLLRYLNVSGDSGADRRVFYSFTESERQPSKDPLVLWLQG